MKNLLKGKMLNGEKTLGSFHVTGNSAVIESMAYGGLDYVILDTEHGPFDEHSSHGMDHYFQVSNQETVITKIDDIDF